MALTTEQVSKWQAIPRFHGYYEVDQIGRVKSLARLTVSKKGWIKSVKEKILKPQKDGVGYLFYCVCVEGKVSGLWAHRAVAEAHIGEIPKGMQVNHKDGIKTNNSVENLEIVTVSENRLHSHRVLKNRGPSGEKNGHAKLNDKTVLEIRNKYSSRICSRKQLAKDYKVSKTTIQGVVTGKNWKQWP